MSTEIQINEHAENDAEHLLYVDGKEARRNPAKRYADASFAVTYAEADGAQIIVAIAALDKAYAQAHAHLYGLLEVVQQRQDREAQRKAEQEGDL